MDERRKTFSLLKPDYHKHKGVIRAQQKSFCWAYIAISLCVLYLRGWVTELSGHCCYIICYLFKILG